MDTALLSAFSALAGSIIGGFSSGATNWLTLRAQARVGHRMHHIAQREELYRDFIVAASAAYGCANLNTEPEIHDIVVLYGMISRMRILSSAEVIACAQQTMDSILDSYASPKLTVREIRASVKDGKRFDPLQEFSRVAREELGIG